MKTSSKTKMTTAIAIILLLASATLMAIPIEAETEYTNMQEGGSMPLPAGVTPDVAFETKAFLSVTPDPIGLGQNMLVNMWTHPTIHVSRYLKDYQVTITKPDGTQDVITMDTYRGDSTAWFEYVADQLGTWTFKFDFLGGYFPAGNYTTYGGLWAGGKSVSSFAESCYYEPSSAKEYQLTVQEDIVYSWPASQLPTDYWTRPAYSENREWWSILGHFPATGVVGSDDYWPANTNKYMSNYDFIPYVQGPNTAHIMWKKEYTIGGLLGGEGRMVTDVLPLINGYGYPTIIYSGRCYETYSKPGVGTSAPTYWRCYDLRTGELFWDRQLAEGEQIPTFVEYAAQGTEVPGATAFEGKVVYLVAISGGRLMKWDPYTGAIAVNVTGPPSGISRDTLYGYPYVLSVQDLGASVPASERYRLINWTIENNAGDWERYEGRWTETIVDNFTARIKGNITWPWNSLGTRQDFEAGISVLVSGITATGTGTAIGQTLEAASMITGEVLWDTTIDDTFFSSSMAFADHGKFACMLKDGETWCWDLYSGKIVWKTAVTSDPWGSFGAYNGQSAYGLIFQNRYDCVSAIDWETGDIVWTYQAETSYSFETPYHMEGTGVYSWHSAGLVADGKFYTVNSEHTPTQPITRGWRLHCINATTGEGIWNISAAGGVPASRTFQGSIADGYLTHCNEYDGYMYVFGKGKSATTIEAPLTAITLGQSVVLKGTVLDQSPAQAGTPCVSKESMTEWMEYLHMQHSIPASVTGVPVSLDVIDANNNLQHIATVTTDGLSGTFGYTWEPEIPGQYTVTASFMGDDSYGTSFATTYVGVVEAPPATAAPEPPVIPDYTLAILCVGIAMILAVAIATVLILRKRQ